MRVAARPPAAASAPAFAVQPSGALQAVAPLDAIEYMLAPRQLPPVQQLSVKAEGGAAAPAVDIQARAAAAAAAATGGGAAAYLAARAVLLEGQPENVDVSFEGVEAGKPVALLHILPAGTSDLLYACCGSLWAAASCCTGLCLTLSNAQQVSTRLCPPACLNPNT